MAEAGLKTSGVPAQTASKDPTVVEAPINYLVDGCTDSVWYSSDSWRSNLPLRTELMAIRDVTAERDSYSLDVQGIQLVCAPTAVTNFRDPNVVAKDYVPELERAVMAATGAKKVVVMRGSVVRLNERSPDFGAPGTTYPGRYAHVDYSDLSGPDVARAALPPEEAEKWMKGRYTVINTWRALSAPPLDTPLCMADARSVEAKDLIISHIVLGPPGGPERRLQTNLVAYNPNHDWVYFRGITRDDLLLFRGYDSDAVRFRRVPHTAFDDPSAGPDAEPRYSIDIRAVAFYGE